MIVSPVADPIAEIKARLDIVDVVGQKVALKKAGRTFKGLCPFHNEKSPSFIVFPDKGNYHCFGCGANGDVFSFVMKTENLDFGETLRLLASRAGVELEPRPTQERANERRNELLRALDAAARYYQQALRRPEAAPAREYLAERGLSSSTLDEFRIGWAPDRWDSLFPYLIGEGYSAETIVAAGLAAQRENGDGYYDRFRGRILFPIHTERGELVGFGGRILDSGQPKYLNSPQTELFDKGSILFGIDRARSAIRASGHVVVVEGYVDVLIAHQSGIKEVVASLGTALTERQVNTLKRLTRTVVLALDADAAGDEAVLRGLEVARQVYGDATVAVPLPQGLVRLESRLDADIRIAALPRGRDPDEIIRENPREWQSLVDQAKSVVDFYFDAVLSRADLSSTKGVAAAVRQLLPIIGEVRDNVQQALYLQRLADRVHIAEQLLASELARLRLTPRTNRSESTSPETTEPPKRAALDEYAIGLLLLYPAQAPPLLNELDEGHWVLVESQEVFREIWRQYQSTGQVSRDAVIAALPGPIADWLRAVLRRVEEHPTLDGRSLAHEQERCLRDLQTRTRLARVAKFESMFRDLEAEGDLTADADVLQKFDQELAQLESVERLSKRARIRSDLA